MKTNVISFPETVLLKHSQAHWFKILTMAPLKWQDYVIEDYTAL